MSLIDSELSKLERVQLNASGHELWTSVCGPPNTGSKKFGHGQVRYDYYFACAFDSAFTALVHAILDNGVLGALARNLRDCNNVHTRSLSRIIELYLQEKWDDVRFVWARDFAPDVYFMPAAALDGVRFFSMWHPLERI